MNTKFKAIIKNINKENIVKVIKSEDLKLATITFACTVPVLIVKHHLTTKENMSPLDQLAVAIGSFCTLQMTYAAAGKLIAMSNSKKAELDK